jgi:hypothetical protein
MGFGGANRLFREAHSTLQLRCLLMFADQERTLQSLKDESQSGQQRPSITWTFPQVQRRLCKALCFTTTTPFVISKDNSRKQTNMDQMMGGGDGGIVGQAGFPLETWFWEMPLCTRWWTTATVLTSALVQCQIVTPFKLFYSYRAVFHQHQVSANGDPNIQFRGV